MYFLHFPVCINGLFGEQRHGLWRSIWSTLHSRDLLLALQSWGQATSNKDMTSSIHTTDVKDFAQLFLLAPNSISFVYALEDSN